MATTEAKIKPEEWTTPRVAIESYLAIGNRLADIANQIAALEREKDALEQAECTVEDAIDELYDAFPDEVVYTRIGTNVVRLDAWGDVKKYVQISVCNHGRFNRERLREIDDEIFAAWPDGVKELAANFEV